MSIEITLKLEGPDRTTFDPFIVNMEKNTASSLPTNPPPPSEKKTVIRKLKVINSLNIHLCGLVHVLLLRCLFRKVAWTIMFESANSLFNYRNLQIE